MTDILPKLAELPMFRSIDAESLKVLASAAKLVKFSRGEYIVKESTTASEIFIVHDGRVDIRITLPGGADEETIATLSPGEILGEMILLGRSRRTATAVAKDAVEIIAWSKDALEKIFASNHHIGFIVMQAIALQLADRLYATNMSLRNALARN